MATARHITTALVLALLVASAGALRRGALAPFSRTRTISTSRRRSSSRNDDQTAAASRRINGMLTKAVQLITAVMPPSAPRHKNGTAAESPATATTTKPKVPVKLSFSASHRHALDLPGVAAAHAYLSLPADAYSVLDSALVSRRADAPDTFILSLPFSDYYQAAMVGTGVGTATAAGAGRGTRVATVVRTDVTVRPDPANGKVVMESGDIVFLPVVPKSAAAVAVAEAEAEAETTSDTGNEDGVDGSSNSDGAAPPPPLLLADILPEWLLWGGKAGDDAPEATAGAVVKSSVQARFRLELSWRPPSPADIQAARTNTRAAAADATIESDTDTGATDTVEAVAEEPLRVTATVKVAVQLNLPVRPDLAFALGILPINLLLAQAGALLTKTFMGTLAPSFAGLLERDFKKRKEEILRGSQQAVESK